MAESTNFFKQLRIDKQMTQSQLAKALNVSKPTISRSETSVPSNKMLAKYSEFFNIPLAKLKEQCYNIEIKNLSKECPTNNGQNKISNQTFADFEMIDMHNLINQIDVCNVPYFESISAGNEMDVINDYPVDFIQVAIQKDSYSNLKNLIAAKVNGDSMNKIIPNHYVVVIDKGAEPKNNDIIAYQLDGNNYGLKRLVISSNYLSLIPESYNPEYHTKTINIEDIPTREFNIIGKVIGVQADFRHMNY